jgi:hypothetical protein
MIKSIDVAKIAKQVSFVITKITSKKTIKEYANDLYFIKKREAAAAFLKKVGLPELFKKQAK